MWNIDPSTLGDPLTQKTQWTPLVGGGSGGRTWTLHNHPRGLEYRRSANMAVVGGCFLAAGLMTLPLALATWWMLGLSLPFLLVSAFFLQPKTMLFDRTQNRATLRGRVIPFADILAVQLLGEDVHGDSVFRSYEVNLVLNDGSRVNVVDHGDLVAVRDDVVRLQELIGCRAWDVTAR
ncbi:MAG: hypothetical protein ACOZQL_26460 [Myxococcota bacterium]